PTPPLHRPEPHELAIRRDVSAQSAALAADVHRARPDLSDPDRTTARRAPAARRAAAPHAVPQAEGADGAHDRRRAGVAGPDAAVARADDRNGGFPLPARRARRDQPGLALGAVPHVFVDERRSAGLVPRLADRRPAARAELRLDDRGLHARAEPVLGRRRPAAPRLRLPLLLAMA